MENKFNNFQCPCCEFYTLPEQPSNTFEICPVCYWEDDGVQFLHHDYTGGANTISLNQARANYRQYGASDPDFVDQVRKPTEEELPD